MSVILRDAWLWLSQCSAYRVPLKPVTASSAIGMSARPRAGHAALIDVPLSSSAADNALIAAASERLEKTVAGRNADFKEGRPGAELRFDEGEFVGSMDACELRAIVSYAHGDRELRARVDTHLKCTPRPAPTPHGAKPQPAHQGCYHFLCLLRTVWTRD